MTEVSWVTGGRLFRESSHWCAQITKGGRAWALGPKGLWLNSTSPCLYIISGKSLPQLPHTETRATSNHTSRGCCQEEEMRLL